jgi:hypothetical protein
MTYLDTIDEVVGISGRVNRYPESDIGIGYWNIS